MRMFAGAMFALVLLGADSGQDLFQKGLVKERASDRKLAAQALFRIAECEEALGSPEARSTYERVVQEYPDQSEGAAEARKRLVALESGVSSTLTARRIDLEQIPYSISADGRWMAITDYSVGDIGIRDMTTNQTRRLLTKPEGVKSIERAESPVLSPDSRQVAYQWFAGYVSRAWSLRVIRNETGAKPRVLVENPEYQRVVPAAWSPDGKAVLATIWKFDNTQQLVWISAADGTVKVLKSLEWRQPTRPSLSPDGRYVAYSALVRSASEERHIYILASDGSNEAEAVDAAGRNDAPAWTPNGGHIVFSSDRSGNIDLWSIAVHDGKPAGIAKLVKKDIGNIASPIGFTRLGSYYYRNQTGGEDIFVARLDENGELGKATRASDRFVGSNHGPEWSPDGKFIAFKRQRPGEDPSLYHGYDLVVRSLETGAEKTYPNSLSAGWAQRPLWFHDGKHILLGMADNQDRISFRLLDLATSQWEEVVPPLISLFRPAAGAHAAFSPDDKTRIGVAQREPAGAFSALSPDDRTLYVNVPDQTLWTGIIGIDLASGERRTVAVFSDWLLSMAISRDGRRLALATGGRSGNRSRLILVETGGRPEDLESLQQKLAAEYAPTGGQDLLEFLATQDPLPKVMSAFPGYRELLAENRNGAPAFSFGGMLAFAPDGREVLFGLPGTGVPGVRIMRISINSGKPEFTGLVIRSVVESLSISPDGSQIAYGDGAQRASEVWALDNLLPVLRAAK